VNAIQRRTRRGQRHSELRTGNAPLDPYKDRSPHRAEGHRRALDHHSQHHRARRREAHCDHEGGGYGGRCPESRRALDEGSEPLSDDDDLNPAVVADVVEAPPNSGYAT